MIRYDREPFDFADGVGSSVSIHSCFLPPFRAARCRAEDKSAPKWTDSLWRCFPDSIIKLFISMALLLLMVPQ